MDQTIIDLLNNSSFEDENLIQTSKEIRRDKVPKTPEDCIAINNSILLDEVNNVFIKDGEPTDAFLEALRRDLDADFHYFHDGQYSQALTKRDRTANADNTSRMKSKKMNKRDITSKTKLGDTCEAMKQQRQQQKCFQEGKALVSSNMNKKCSKTLEQGQMGYNAYHGNKNVKNLIDNVNNNQQIDQDALNKDLRSTNAKLQSKLKAIEKMPPSRSEHEEERHVDFLTKEMDNLKKQLLLSEMRTDEEISERLKWEERCRNWKHSAEQMKQKLHATENSVNSKLESESMKLGKSTRRIISKLETDIASLKSQLLDVQNKLRREELASSDLLSRIEKNAVLIQDLKDERRHLLEQVEERNFQLGVISQRDRVCHMSNKHFFPPPPKSNSESTSLEVLEQWPLSSSKTSHSNASSSYNIHNNISSDTEKILTMEDNAVYIKQNLHSDTVALIKSIAAKTVTSLPRNAVRSDVERMSAVSVATETVVLDKLYEKIRGVK